MLLIQMRKNSRRPPQEYELFIQSGSADINFGRGIHMAIDGASWTDILILFLLDLTYIFCS